MLSRQMGNDDARKANGCRKYNKNIRLLNNKHTGGIGDTQKSEYVFREKNAIQN